MSIAAKADFPIAEEFGEIFDSVAREAQRIEPGRNYVEALPERRRACVTTAYRVFGRGGTAGLVMEKRLLAHCYLVIVVRIEELYYKTPDNSGVGIAARARNLSASLYSVFSDIYRSTRRCAEQPTIYCGSMHQLSPYDDYLHLVADIMDSMASHVAHEVDSVRDFKAWRNAWDAAENFPK